MGKLKIKGSLKNKLVSFLFLVISLGIVYAIIHNVQQTREVEYVPVLNREVLALELITEDDIKMMEIGAFNMPDEIVKVKEDMIGKYAARTLIADRYLYKEDFESQKPQITAQERIKGGALAVETDLIKCAGGLPNEGDNVKVNIIVKGRENGVEIKQFDELSKVKILAIKDSVGAYIKKDSSSANDSGGFGTTQRDSKPAMIIFDVTPEQEILLLKGLYSGQLHLVMLPMEEQDYYLGDKVAEGEAESTEPTEETTIESVELEPASDEDTTSEIIDPEAVEAIDEAPETTTDQETEGQG